MAENKKSFLLYADLLNTFETLTDDEAGQLIKHLLKYVNDLNPISENRIINIAFEPIKQQLKRDLKRWEDIKIKRSESGKLGGRPKQDEAKKAKGLLEKQTKAKKAVTVTVNDTVTVNVKKNIYPSFEEFKKYCQENGFENIAERAFKGYSENDWHNSKGKKVLNWKSTLQNNWFREDNKIKIKDNSKPSTFI